MDWYVILVIVATILGLFVIIVQRRVLILQQKKISEQDLEIQRLQLELSELADLKIPKEPMFEVKHSLVPLLPLKYKKVFTGPLAQMIEAAPSDKRQVILNAEMYYPFCEELRQYIKLDCVEDHEDLKVFVMELTIADVNYK